MSGLLPPGPLTYEGQVAVPYINRTSPPTTAFNKFPVPTLWIDTVNKNAYLLVNVALGIADWAPIGGVTAQVSTLKGNSGFPVPPTVGNINVVGDGSTITVAGNPGTSTLTISPSASGYPITPYVVGPVGQAGYQTIQSAIDAANADGGGTVYIQPGVYTEDLTLYSGVDLWGAVGIADTYTCVIIGVHTPPLSGTQTIRNIFLQSATHIYSSASPGTATLILIDCAMKVTNGFTFNCPNWVAPGGFAGFDIGVIGSTNDGWVNNTGGATIFMTNVTMGAGSSHTMTASGFCELYNCVVKCPTNFVTGSSALVDGGTLFQNTVTLSNNSTGSINNSSISSGSSAGLTMSSSSAWSLSSCTITSSNNPAIAGAGSGTLTISDVSFLSNASIAGTLTLGSSSVYPTKMSNGQLLIGSTGQPAVATSLTAGANITITPGAGSITIAATGGGSALAWQTISANRTLDVNNGYICVSPGGALSLALPGTSSVGDVIEVTLDGATSFSITQGTGQQIRLSNSQTTAGGGGSLTTTHQGDSIRIVCSEANLKWNVLSSMGNITVI